jgi:hypothetical protein
MLQLAKLLADPERPLPVAAGIADENIRHAPPPHVGDGASSIRELLRASAGIPNSAVAWMFDSCPLVASPTAAFAGEPGIADDVRDQDRRDLPGSRHGASSCAMSTATSSSFSSACGSTNRGRFISGCRSLLRRRTPGSMMRHLRRAEAARGGYLRQLHQQRPGLGVLDRPGAWQAKA